MYFIFRLFGHQVWRKVSLWWRSISDSHIYSTDTIVGGILTTYAFFSGYLASKFGGKYPFGGGVFLTAIFTLLTPLCVQSTPANNAREGARQYTHW